MGEAGSLQAAPPHLVKRLVQAVGAPGAFVAIAMLAVTFVVFPGQLLPDTLEQLRQAREGAYSDWHPPVMAAVWRLLLQLTGSEGSLLLLHQLLYGTGFVLLADGCARAGMRKRAWALALLALFPLFVFYNRMVIKDIAMTSAFLGAAGVLFWYRVQHRAMPWAAAVVLALMLAYGVLVRANAAFALGPLLLLWAGRRWGGWKTLPACAAITLLALAAGGVVNHRLLHAHRGDVIQQLQIYDLAGIQVRSGDSTVWGRHAVPLAGVRACYTPLWWDPFSSWGQCAGLRAAMGQGGNDNPPQVVEERTALWLKAILKHPGAYLSHRLAHFNSSVYFVVPSFHIRFKRVDGSGAGADTPEALRTKVRWDYAKVNALVWPVTWLVVGALALAALARAAATGPTQATARALLLSALLYSSAYAVIGIATEVRYHYWSIAAVMCACVLAAPDLAAAWRASRGFRVAVTGAVLGTLVLGYAARLADWPIV